MMNRLIELEYGQDVDELFKVILLNYDGGLFFRKVFPMD